MQVLNNKLVQSSAGKWLFIRNNWHEDIFIVPTECISSDNQKFDAVWALVWSRRIHFIVTLALEIVAKEMQAIPYSHTA